MNSLAFIKNRKAFHTIHYETPIDYETPVGSDEKDTGQFIFADDLQHTFLTIKDPYWLCYENYIFKIVSVDSADGLITVTVEPPIAVFSRTNIDYSFRFVNTGMGAWLKNMIDQNYVVDTHYVADSEYAMPYLTVINNDSSAVLTPDHSPEFLVPMNEGQPGQTMMPSGLFNTYDYLLKANQNNTMFGFSFTSGNVNPLVLNIKTKPEKPYVLINNDGHTKVTSFNYDKEVISKLRVFIISRNENNESYINNPYSSDCYHTYYLKTDGQFVRDTIPDEEDRVIGKWETRSIYQATENQIEAGITDLTICDEEAGKVFAQNLDKISIEFYSDKDLEWGLPVRIIINNVPWTGQISKKIISSKDDRFFYTIGDLKTTITQKLLSLL